MNKIDTGLVNNIMDAFECAREALALLPPMSAKIKPVYLRILSAIYKTGGKSGSARVTDISKVSGLLLPNTTKFINEMVELDLVEKFTSESDKRVVLVRATELGQQYIHDYVISFLDGLEKEFSQIGEADCIIMIETINKVSQAMKTVYQR
ncbi:MAG: MarR family transcriptional regulator [Syntrophomonadaceae bacterium]|nr:MarR family transcriptional regulator [Syntrophomonadaceae bacterium]